MQEMGDGILSCVVVNDNRMQRVHSIVPMKDMYFISNNKGKVFCKIP